MAETPKFTWDMESDADRERYRWPQARVLAWWQEALEKGWCSTDESKIALQPATDADRELETALTAIGLAWATKFGTDAGGNALYWDPFHLPLYDPHTGELTPKHEDFLADRKKLSTEDRKKLTQYGSHPEAEKEWTAAYNAFHKAFAAAIFARMAEAGEASSPLADLQGLQVPGKLYFGFYRKTGESDEAFGKRKQDRQHNPELFARFDGSLFGHAFVVWHGRFGGDEEAPGGGTARALSFLGAQFSGTPDFNSAQFRGTADFSSAQFSGTAIFRGAQFSGTTNFSGARASGTADFEDAQFSGDADFRRAQFGRYAIFRGAQFSGDADFRRAQFSGNATFSGAQFRGTADFSSAQFNGYAEFRGAQFSETATFNGAQFSEAAYFSVAQFNGYAEFRGAQFSQTAYFSVAQFSRTATFSGAQFSQTADFWGAQFSGTADFWGAQFSETATFNGAQFSGTATFRGAQFSETATFNGAQFSGYADFSLGSSATNRSKRHMVVREDTASSGTRRFTISRDMSDVPGWQGAAAFKSIVFTGAFFLGGVTFENRLFGSAAQFDNAFFAKAPRFHGAILHRDTSFLDTEFFAAPGAPKKARRPRRDMSQNRLARTLAEVDEDFEYPLKTANAPDKGDKAEAHRLEQAKDAAKRAVQHIFAPLTGGTSNRPITLDKENAIGLRAVERAKARVAAINNYAKSLDELSKDRKAQTDTGQTFERAYQTLKIHMDGAQARSDEQKFFALELQSRRIRTDKEVTLLERAFSHLYDWTSNYGRSITRPALWLLVFIPVAMFLIYHALGLTVAEGTLTANWRNWLSFLYEPAFNPLASLNLGKIHSGFHCFSYQACAALNFSVDGERGWFVAAATLHRLLNVALLFILLLSIRRRFQIS